jgi:hypothetical protein
MVTSYGEVSYSDEFPSNKRFDSSKDVWFRLDNGDNELRLVTLPFQYLTHKVKKDPLDKRDFGQKVNCSAPNGSCPACAFGEAKPRYLYGAISRKDGTYRILDISLNTFLQIRKLAQNVARWGDPTKYDINIIKDPTAGPAGFYSVQPLPKEPLSAADQQIRDNANVELLKRQTVPPTPEFVQRRLDKIFEGTTQPLASKKTSGKVDVTDTDDSEDFPAYGN